MFISKYLYEVSGLCNKLKAGGNHTLIFAFFTGGNYEKKEKSGAGKMIAAVVVVVILLCGIFAIMRNLASPASADNKAGNRRYRKRQQKLLQKHQITVCQ